MLGICDILVRIRIQIRGSTPLTSVADPDPDPHVFGLPDLDPDPLVRCMDPDPYPALDPALDPDPSIIMQK